MNIDSVMVKRKPYRATHIKHECDSPAYRREYYEKIYRKRLGRTGPMKRRRRKN